MKVAFDEGAVVNLDTGEIIIPVGKRYRARDIYLTEGGAEIPDSRPMVASVAFQDELSVDDQVRRIIAQTMFQSEIRMQQNMQRHPNQDFYDEDDSDLEPDYEYSVDNLESPYEFVQDEVAQREVPRAMKGSFKARAKASEKAVQKGKGKASTPTAPEPSPAEQGESADEPLEQ